MIPHDFLYGLVTAFALGALIGLERQLHSGLSGIRTNALVCLGAAMFCSLTHLIPVPTADSPMRVAAQVVTGIGFLGAGVIMHEGLQLHGIDTAATLWVVAAVGTLCGLGLRVEAAVGAAFVLVTNVILRPVSKRLDRYRESKKNKT